ncbi:tryptophan-rich sensory protein [Candidatus Dojkabacteria bacterium]|nr:tryptophan-rich sensory protein [Candidatus Dojkabacteria bacterium]
MKKILNSAIFITICQSAGLIGTAFTMQSIPTWYASLNKPSFTPPNWLFGPAWLTLYTLMGISISLIWKNRNNPSKSEEAKSATTLFFIHLFLNAIWTPVFFGAKLVFPAFIIIVAIAVFIIVLMIKFWKINKIASYLLIPYLLWVSFASALNFAVWILNR